MFARAGPLSSQSDTARSKLYLWEREAETRLSFLENAWKCNPSAVVDLKTVQTFSRLFVVLLWSWAAFVHKTDQQQHPYINLVKSLTMNAVKTNNFDEIDDNLLRMTSTSSFQHNPSSHFNNTTNQWQHSTSMTILWNRWQRCETEGYISYETDDNAAGQDARKRHEK